MEDSRKPGKPPRNGLAPRKAKLATPRPARGPVRCLPPIPPPPQAPPIEIHSRRELATKREEIVARINAHPELSVMFLINPVLAMKDLGVELSSEVIDHVLHRMQHPVELRQRRESLEAGLAKELGEAPRPQDAAWVSQLLFEKLKLKPLATAGQAPRYLQPINAEVLARLKRRRPTAKPRYPGARRTGAQSRVTVTDWNPAIRRLDLKTPSPTVPAAAAAPKAVTLEDLYFYKDLNETARQVLELGIIQRQSFPFHTPDAYRRIRAGQKPNAFRAWIRSVRFSNKKPADK